METTQPQETTGKLTPQQNCERFKWHFLVMQNDCSTGGT